MNTHFFGTDGIRTPVGSYPLTYQELPLLGAAIARWVEKKYGTSPTIALGHDTRISASFIKAALKAGLLLHSLTIHDAYVITTPGLSKLIQQDNKLNSGIIISASHNPYQYNGIKLLDESGKKISVKDEWAIQHYFDEYAHTPPGYNRFGRDTVWPEARMRYHKLLTQEFRHDFLRGKTIILDCAHGATSYYAPAIFTQFSAHVHTINNKPNGTNINDLCGSEYPDQLQKAVIQHNADIGFAFDGDGDRVIAVNARGDIKNGDDILALLLAHPRYRQQHSLVGTVMSNHGLEQFLKTQGKKLIRTQVGDKYIADQLHRHHLLLGGEQSGHIITGDYLPTGDGIFTALRLLETLIYTDNWHMETFTKYPQILINIPTAPKNNIQEEPYASIIKTYAATIPQGRILVRYSGTEPMLRIMVEEENRSTAEQIAMGLSRDITNALHHTGV